ncbi:MAG TPA: catechol 1,2-dioxygenase [Vicinamibacteria bacterium]|nr:catechol 1,2-dioxygenase [Vicinamibacteria bacterium]
MGEVVGAGLLSHAPTIMLPQETRYELNEGKEISLVPGLRRLRGEVLDRLRADTFVIFDTHWFSTVEHLVASHAHRSGKFTSDELPRGMCQVPYDYDGDPELATLTAEIANEQGTRSFAVDDPCLPLHYPTINLVTYLHAGERVVSVSIAQTGEPHDFLAFGAALGRAIEKLDRRVVLMASGGMSHRFWPLGELEKHESSDPIHIRTPEARSADESRIALMEKGDHARIIATMDDYLPFSPEGQFGHYLMMVGALGGGDCIAPGKRFSEYENATGTGQVHVWFERPEAGWMGRSRNR